MRRVDQDRKISLLNLSWGVPKAEPDQGVRATLVFSASGAKLRFYDAASDAYKCICLAVHPFLLEESVQPLSEESQHPIAVGSS